MVKKKGIYAFGGGMEGFFKYIHYTIRIHMYSIQP
jgi:hypothetical protein